MEGGGEEGEGEREGEAEVEVVVGFCSAGFDTEAARAIS